MKILKKINKGIAWAENAILIVLLIALIVIVFAQVFWRYVLNNPLQSTEELGRICMLWIVFIGAGATTRLNQHIRLTMLTDKFSAKANYIINIIVQLLLLVFALYTIKYGLYFAKQQLITQMPSLPWPKTVASSSICAFGFLTVYHSAYNILLLILKDPDAPQWQEVKV